ncbi:porin family protein [Chryseobacterium culicis]|uniref:Outer membrane protein beta-barrel domain-containing protein n=1 Tax=Chryseobacterium culicis TaxID=680127 RepID=A0A1H6H7G8_CHRCI|nr:porin family protein [Chryseobacterium culicis]SEH29943.1 Outer membrane protein beta-barrel domain-containing protein [Chryseobacterium culicis]
MKKQLLSICIVLGTMTFAQSSDGPRFGLKAGGNLSSFTGGDSKSKIGFYAGAFVNVPLSESFSIQPEVVYSQQGAKAKDDYEMATYTIKNMQQNLGYINVPIMLQYNATPELYFEAGPEFGLLVSAQAKGDINGSTYKANNKDNLKNFNFGAGIGLGYKFTPHLGVNVRYVAGLTKVLKNEFGDSSKNTNFQLGINYYF